MSKATVGTSTSNQLKVDYDISKIFIFGNRYSSATFINNTGGALAFAPGTIVGRVAASGKIAPFLAGATDGSQIPIGILKTEVPSIADDAELTVNFCTKGDVVEGKLLLQNSETLATVVASPASTTNVRIVRDMIEAVGINIIESDELTEFDN